MAELPTVFRLPLSCVSSLFHDDDVLNCCQTINGHDSDHRSSSAMAYLTPVESQRTNWLTLTQHMVSQSITNFYQHLLTISTIGYQNQLGKRRDPDNRLRCGLCAREWWLDSVYGIREERGYLSCGCHSGQTRFPVSDLA